MIVSLPIRTLKLGYGCLRCSMMHNHCIDNDVVARKGNPKRGVMLWHEWLRPRQYQDRAAPHMHLPLLILPGFFHCIASIILAGDSSDILLTYIAAWCKRLCIAGVWPLPTSSHTGSTLLWFHSDWASTSHQCKRLVPLTDDNLLIINCWQFLITSWHRLWLQKYHWQCSSNVCANLAIIL